MECPLCRVPLMAGATHCSKCGLRVAPLARTRHSPCPGPPGRGEVLTALARGVLGGAGMIALSAVLALGLRDGSGFRRPFENAIGVSGGVVTVLAFFMGPVRHGAWRRDLDVAARMTPGQAAAAPGTRVVVAMTGGIPLALALVLAVVGN